MSPGKLYVLICCWIMLVSGCNQLQLDYIQTDCGETQAQTDTISFTRQNFPANPAYEDFGDLAVVGLRLIAENFCPKNPVQSQVSIELMRDSVPVGVSAIILSDEDTLQIPLSWENRNNVDLYSGSISDSFSDKNPGETFVVRIDMIFKDLGGFYKNTEYLKKSFVSAKLSASYQRKQ